MAEGGIRVGTSGFDFERWRAGGFYPRSARPLLTWYAQRFGFVEVDSTFYGPPRPSTLERWCREVPASFRFSVKVPREITHESAPDPAAAQLRDLLLAAAELEGKLACLLFQFPPRLRADPRLLEALLEAVPRGLPAAFEFRHPSWFTPSVARRLLDSGKAFCATSVEQLEVLPAPGFCYLRLPGTGFSQPGLGHLRSTLEARGFSESFVVFRDQARLDFPRDAWLFEQVVRPPQPQLWEKSGGSRTTRWISSRNSSR